MNNLPQEIKTKISTEAQASANVQDFNYPSDNWECGEVAEREHIAGYELGATEWAGKYATLREKYDNILATESGHESQTENVWQSGYASGHEAATERHKKECDELQAKCSKYERERHETRLALRMLLKAFSKTELSAEQSKFYLKADSILDKYYHVDDILRNEALSGEGEKDEIRKQNIEAEITRRWNSIEYNHIGTRTRESYREEVEKLFNQKEDKQ